MLISRRVRATTNRTTNIEWVECAGGIRIKRRGWSKCVRICRARRNVQQRVEHIIAHEKARWQRSSFEQKNSINTSKLPLRPTKSLWHCFHAVGPQRLAPKWWNGKAGWSHQWQGDGFISLLCTPLIKARPVCCAVGRKNIS